MVYTATPGTKGVKAAAGISFNVMLFFNSKMQPCLVILPQRHRSGYAQDMPSLWGKGGVSDVQIVKKTEQFKKRVSIILFSSKAS